MTLDLAKIKSDAEIIASRCDMLLMTLPVRDVLAMVAEIERLSKINNGARLVSEDLCEKIEIQTKENNRLRDLAENLRKLFGQSNETISNFYLTIKKLKDENEALRKDAYRYRWMRDHGCPSMESWFYELRAGEITKDQADSEIDEAMTKESP